MDPLALPITLAEDGAPPTEFRILPKGKTETSKGDVMFTEASSAAVMRAYQEHGADLMLDYGHGAFNPHAPPDSAGKAAGWFKPAIREGELWATEVAWTPAAIKALSDREYRYFSPALRLSSQTREVTRLLNVALTNMPATKNLPALMASETTSEETKMEDNETEKALLAAMKALKVDNLNAALGAITALSETAAKVPALEARVAAFEAAEKKSKVAVLLAKAKEEGRVAESEMVNLSEAGEKDPAWLEGYLKNKPVSAVAEPEKKEPKNEGGKLIKLSATQRKVARQMGVSEEAFIKTQNDMDEFEARQREEAEAI